MSQEPMQAVAALIAAAQSLSARGLNVNKAGNVSVRLARDGVDGFLITPTGVPYEQLQPCDLSWLPIRADTVVSDAIGKRAPSSEWMMHLAVYRLRGDAQSVVHTHSPYATALACQNLPIPPFHYMVATAGAMSIDVVPYATFGTAALADSAATGLFHANACLLEHHGVLVCAPSLERALSLAVEVENLAHQYVIVRSLGEPRLLSPEEMQRVIERFKTYGQPRNKDDE